MRGTFWETFEAFEVEVVRGFAVLMLELTVSERVNAAGLKVSSMVAVIVSHATDEEDRSYMRLHGLRECLRRVL